VGDVSVEGGKGLAYLGWGGRLVGGCQAPLRMTMLPTLAVTMVWV